MKLKKALVLARKNKCTISSSDCHVFKQNIKTIMYWLLLHDADIKVRANFLTEILQATDWKLDLTTTEKVK